MFYSSTDPGRMERMTDLGGTSTKNPWSGLQTTVGTFDCTTTGTLRSIPFTVSSFSYCLAWARWHLRFSWQRMSFFADSPVTSGSRRRFEESYLDFVQAEDLCLWIRVFGTKALYCNSEDIYAPRFRNSFDPFSHDWSPNVRWCESFISGIINTRPKLFE